MRPAPPPLFGLPCRLPDKGRRWRDGDIEGTALSIHSCSNPSGKRMSAPMMSIGEAVPFRPSGPDRGVAVGGSETDASAMADVSLSASACGALGEFA